MLESKDILFFVLAFCALWFTLFLSWLIWQLARILKNVNDVLGEAKEQLRRIEEAITSMKEKFDSATSGFGLFLKAIEKVVGFVIDNKQSKKKDDNEKEEK